MIRNIVHSRYWLLLVIIIAIAALFLEYGMRITTLVFWIIQVLDFFVLLLLISEFYIFWKEDGFRFFYIRNNIFSTIFTLLFVILFLYSKTGTFTNLLSSTPVQDSMTLVILRNIFIALKIFSRFRKLNSLLRSFISKPAQTIILSFGLLILTGTLLLMLPYSSAERIHMPFLDALFTSTSAVCVTGLIVVDTASYFSLFGQAVIMLLIQFGGLGIMMFGFFTAFAIRQRISIEDRMALSYMLGESDQMNIQKSVFKIIGTTFIIESIGALLLAGALPIGDMPLSTRIFHSLFHSVSAFCNAGFALYSDSLESFYSNYTVILTIGFLIILGGLGFPVYNNLYSRIKCYFIRYALRRRVILTKISLNSQAVLVTTLILLIGGTLLIYGLEHNMITGTSIPGQYVNAFFQSVTLRTAGFNSMDFTSMRISTYILMMIFMFIGGAAGSTAGGIKVNTVAVIYSYMKSVIQDKDRAILFNHFINRETILKAFLSVTIGILIVFAGIFALSMTENADIIKLSFEVVSAFGTVGLSAGVTSSLTGIGKFIIILIMFAGRLGILTVISAIARTDKVNIRYPEGNINIG